MPVRPLAVAVAALTLVLAAVAVARAQAPAIKVEGAWARRAPMGGEGGTPRGNGAVYLTVRNGAAADALVAAATAAADVTELHETYDMSGMSMMRQVEKIAVPAGKTVVLKPGGFHLMLVGLRRDLKVGETVSLTLTFEKAGAVKVAARVK